MVLQQRPNQVPDDTEPPFLQEPTVTVVASPTRQPMDLLVDFVYRWRLALALGLVPVLLAALALSVEPAKPIDPLVGGGQDDEGSSIEAFLSGFGIEGSLTTDSVEGVTASTSARTAPSTTADQPTTGPSTTAPPTTVPPTTTPPTTVPPATEPPTTEPPTTEPPATTTTLETTTAPPTTAQPCMISVRRPAPLRAEPDDDSDRIGLARRGTFPGLAAQEGWVLVDYNGTVGWIEDRFVNGVEGNC